MIRYLLVLIFLSVVGAAGSVGAQDLSECDQRRADADETIARSIDNFRDKDDLEARARNQILTIYKVCDDENVKSQYGPVLLDIEEHQADRLFVIAKYYFNLARTGKGGAKGAESRLREIIGKFADYSKLDEVFLVLGRIYVLEGRTEDATTTFTDLIHKYPASPLAYKAQTYIDRLAAKASP